MRRFRPGHLVVAFTLFAALAVGGTGAILLVRYRSAALAAVADRQALLVSLQARLIDVELTRLVGEVGRLSQLAEVDLADGNLEPEKRVLRIARRDTVLFSVAIAILDEHGRLLWSEPQGTSLGTRGAALVGEARGNGRPVLSFAPGEFDVAAPIAGRGAIVGKVAVAGRDLFGDALQRALRHGGGVALLQAQPGAVDGPALAASGATLPPGLAAGGGQAWREDTAGPRWLITESRIGDGPLLLRLAQPAAGLEAEVDRSLGTLAGIVAAALLLAALGGALLALAVARLERAEVELDRSRGLAAMGKTAAAIAHEVKNSLNGLSVALDLLGARSAPPAVAEQVHAQARSEIARLRGVADDLTLFAAPPMLELADVDLADLARRALDSASDLAQDCGVALAFDAPSGGARVRGDAHKLLGALQNLVRNGVEAMGPGAFGEALGAPAADRERRLELAVLPGADEVVVEVRDRGAGIAPNVRARLFEPFVTTKRSGTGLGLAIARRVVEAHGGTVEALPREDGGTVFRVRLPVAPARRHERRIAVARAE